MDILLGQVRHFLTIAGGSLGASGLLTDNEFQQGLGAIATLAGLAWSAWRNWKGRAA